ncbi:MAG: S8 family serine peptidase [Candidatus Odinarchaeota archaeon]
MEKAEYKFLHPLKGLSVWEENKLLVRWEKGITEEERYGIIKGQGLKLIESIESASIESAMRLKINNTDAIWWVENVNIEPISEEVIEELEISKEIRWVAPVYRKEKTEKELMNLFSINPARLHLNQSLLTKSLLSSIKNMGLEVEIKQNPSTHHTGRVTLIILNVNMRNKKGTVQLAQNMLDILGNQDNFNYKHDIRFENIPFISPQCVKIPDDPHFEHEWGMWKINAPYSWDETCGDPNIIIAVIDSGVELNHPDLNVNSLSWNASNDEPDGSPVGSHGTACAGIIAARINNGLGVAGVAGECQIMALATSTWADTDIEELLYFAADNNARIVSMSFGVYESWDIWDLEIIREALQYAHNMGLILLAASGNEDLSSIRFPGTDIRTICVGGSNHDDVRKSMTSDIYINWGACYGEELDVVAPCIEIPTTDLLGNAGYSLEDYTLDFSGTSSATPHVAGLAAMILSVEPSLSNIKVREIIERACDKISPFIYDYTIVDHKPNGTWNNEVGYGRINIERALVLTSKLKISGKELEFLKEIHWKRHKNITAVIKPSRNSLIPLTRQTVIERVPVGINPCGIAFDGSHIWVTNSKSNNISKIDITTNTVMATVAVGKSPHGIAFDGSHIWVTNSNSNNVCKIDISTNIVIATVAVGRSPYGIAFDGTSIWVANNRSNDLHKIDIFTNNITARIGLGWQSHSPKELAFDGVHIWVTHKGLIPSGPTLSKFDSFTNRLKISILGRGSPHQLAYDGTHLWVANQHRNRVTKINVKKNSVICNISVGKKPYGVIFDGTHVWVTNYHSNNLSKIDIQSDSVIKVIGLGHNPLGLAFDGTDIWIAENYQNDSSLQNHYVSKVSAIPLGVEAPSTVID